MAATMGGQWRRLAEAVATRVQALADATIARWYWLRGRAIPHEVRRRVVETANRRAHGLYIEKPYGGTMVLFRAVDEVEHAGADGALGWRGVTSGRLEIIELPGTHREFIEQPDLAHALRAVLEQAQREAVPAAAPASAAQSSAS